MWVYNEEKKDFVWTGSGKPDLTTKPGGTIVIPPKSSKKAVKTYIWTTDKKGNVVKVEATTAKKSFATLDEDTQIALAEFLQRTNVTPTTYSLSALWGKIVDGAVAEYKAGRQSTPKDVLKILIDNTPINEGVTSTVYKSYDPVTANAYLNNIAAGIGFDVNLLTPEERADFAKKIDEEARMSGKQTTRKTVEGGVETVITPDIFDPKTFAQNWLWAKVNLNDVTKLPSSAITELTTVKKVLDGFNIDYLSQAEINQLSVDLASKKITTQSIMDKYRAEAIKNYPLLGDRMLASPGSTVLDILDPAVSIISKWLEIPKSEIKLNNKFLDKYARPDGPAGKVQMPSLYDLEVMVKNSEEAEKTSWANEGARDGAIGLARAMGFGI
jgi:hypothetical protein